MKNLFTFFLLASFAAFCVASEIELLDDPKNLYEALEKELENLETNFPEKYADLVGKLQSISAKIYRQKWCLKGLN